MKTTAQLLAVLLVLAGAVAPTRAEAVTLDPGDILVADYNFGGPGGNIIHVNPATGAQTTVSNNAISSGAGGGAFVVAPMGMPPGTARTPGESRTTK